MNENGKNGYDVYLVPGKLGNDIPPPPRIPDADSLVGCLKGTV